MGALADLLKQAAPAATPATCATPTPNTGKESQESQESQGYTAEMRLHLLTLAADELLPAAIVHRLHDADLTACHGCTDSALRAYLRALVQSERMDAGNVPAGYTMAAQCSGCGPVWLWPGAPARVIACPWCFRRKAGKAIPRPPISCGDCRHFQPDPLNPEAGMGDCGHLGKVAWRPLQEHRCTDHSPENAGLDK